MSDMDTLTPRSAAQGALQEALRVGRGTLKTSQKMLQKSAKTGDPESFFKGTHALGQFLHSFLRIVEIAWRQERQALLDTTAEPQRLALAARRLAWEADDETDGEDDWSDDENAPGDDENAPGDDESDQADDENAPPVAADAHPPRDPPLAADGLQVRVPDAPWLRARRGPPETSIVRDEPPQAPPSAPGRSFTEEEKRAQDRALDELLASMAEGSFEEQLDRRRRQLGGR